MNAKRPISNPQVSAVTPRSPAQLLVDIQQLIAELLNTGEGLLLHYEHKSSAMQRASADEMLKLTDIETSLTQRLERSLSRRRTILKDAGLLRLPHRTLRELIVALPGAPREEWDAALTRIQQQSQRLRLIGWSHWIVAHRTQSHYNELIDLIAQGGYRSPTYSQHAQREGKGGVLLDASI
ncbi:MAG: hypothetical protein O2955_16335 [Planctomycetota bacterium]|nr:hypothetical protein [Planctomycetota bacterium]MDA1214081.1 hypothetical protein [Planctomycetota bacterium]